MNKITTLITGLLLAAQPVFTIFDVTANAGYMSSTLTNTSQGSSIAADGTGYLASGAAHVNFGIPLILKIGIGPEVGFGNQSLKVSGVTTSTNSQNALRFGLDSYIQLELVPVIKPFLRITVGKETLTNTNSGTASGQRTELVSEYGALYYNFLFGLNLPIAGPLSMFVQGGPTGGTKGSATIKSYSVNGVSQAVVSTTSEVSYSGFLINGGIMLSF